MGSPEIFGPYLTLIAFLIAAVFATTRDFRTAPGIDKVQLLGRICLAIPIAVFGSEHLTSPQAIARVVPPWMPGKLFWTCFVGVSLIAAALSILFRVRMRLSATLLGIMLLCFVAMIHIPNALAAPHKRIAWTLVGRDSAFGAGALLLSIAAGARKRTPAENRVAVVALYWIALVSAFYGLESLLHPAGVPAVPLERTTPLWIPLARFWTVLTGVALLIGAGAMLPRSTSRLSAAALGAWVVLIVLTLYLAMMIAKPDIEGLNYFADTLMFASVLLLAAGAYEAPRPPDLARSSG